MVDFCSEKQLIRGFGGMNHPLWIGDLTPEQRATAFGNGDGQLGFTIVRTFVSENSNDWSREVATAKAAIGAGGIAFASPWNPPASMKSGGSIDPAWFAAYAKHLNDYVTFMKNNGVDLYAISVQNEPDYANDWTAWTPQQVHDFLVGHRAAIQTRVITAESFQYRKALYDPLLSDEAARASWDILGAHLYGTALKDFPYPLFDQKGAGKERWMTEHYTDSANDADLWPMALDVGYELHNAMVEAEFNAYTWWYIRRKYGPMKEDGTISKRGACMAQFSKFVRPGYHRVEATKNPVADVYVSAYRGEKDVVLVAVNRGTSSRSVTVSLSGTAASSLEKITTSGSKSLAREGVVPISSGAISVTLDGQSVTTFHGKEP